MRKANKRTMRDHLDANPQVMNRDAWKALLRVGEEMLWKREGIDALMAIVGELHLKFDPGFPNQRALAYGLSDMALILDRLLDIQERNLQPGLRVRTTQQGVPQEKIQVIQGFWPDGAVRLEGERGRFVPRHLILVPCGESAESVAS